MSRDELYNAYVPHLKKLNPNFSPDWIEEIWHFKEAAAQPVFPLNYSTKIPPYRTPIRNFYLGNTTQIYPEDRGTNFPCGWDKLSRTWWTRTQKWRVVVTMKTLPKTNRHRRLTRGIMSQVVYRGKSKFQKILVFDSPFHGRVLASHSIVQLTREDLFYHEMLVHPTLQAHPNPRNVLMIGGGDGGTMSEVVNYPSIESAVECELDRHVVTVAKKYFPKLAAGYKTSARMCVLKMAKFLRESGQVWDAIILDLTDPIGPAKPLFERPFYKLCAEHLAPNGFLSAQTESLHFHADTVKSVIRAIRDLFAYIELVTIPLAMYPGNWWTFTVASKSLDPKLRAIPSLRQPRLPAG